MYSVFFRRFPVLSLSSCLTPVYSLSSCRFPVCSLLSCRSPEVSLSSFLQYTCILNLFLLFPCIQYLFLPFTLYSVSLPAFYPVFRPFYCLCQLYSVSLPAFYPVFSLSSCLTLVFRISYCLLPCIQSLLRPLPASCRSPVFRISLLPYPQIVYNLSSCFYLVFHSLSYIVLGLTFLLPAMIFAPPNVRLLASYFS